MAIQFHNTLSGKVEEFRPLEDLRVRMYTCGPTVYDYAHIGNFRTFVFQDILRRHLKYRGYAVNQVMNLTDVDDRTIANSNAAGVPLRDYTAKYIEAFLADRDLLSLESPERLVRATDHIEAMARVIGTLVQKGYAYESDGSYYFRVKNFPDYGKLSKNDFSGMKDGARVDSDKYEKDDARDFVLWKAAKAGEPSWETPLGRGRPGWHIECSVMAMTYLGETLDIHSGGSDLIFPHHENEIAQSEAATGKPFARTWLHAEHLIVDGQKMSKSLGNFYTLRDLIAKGHKPSSIRYLLASVPYRRPLNFSMDGLQQAHQSIERLRNFRYRLTRADFPSGSNEPLAAMALESGEGFGRALDDNLNTAEALGAIFDLVREGNAAMDAGEFRADERDAFLDVLDRSDRIFAVLEDNDYAKLKKYGLVVEGLSAGKVGEVPASGNGTARVTLSGEEIEKLVEARNSARRHRDFARADKIRDELLNAGVILEDTRTETRWKRT